MTLCTRCHRERTPYHPRFVAQHAFTGGPPRPTCDNCGESISTGGDH